jgi:non-heme Fe2+,alpha-ketoglutarate-dependent halogenase
MKRPPLWLLTFPLFVGYVLCRMTFLHRWLPARLKYQLPWSWNEKMMKTFVGSLGRRVYIDTWTTLDVPAKPERQVEVAPEYRLTDGELEKFWRTGWTGPFDVKSNEDTKALEKHFWDVFLAESKTYPRDSYRYVGDRTPGQEGEAGNEKYARYGLNGRDKHLEDPALLDFYTHPAVVERIAQLIGPDILFWRSQFFPKVPGAGGTGWHQATTYLNETMRVATLTPTDSRRLFQVTAWFAMTDVTVKTACLRFQEGTHTEMRPITVTEYDPVKHKDNKSDRFGTKILQPDPPVDESQVVDIVMKAGQFILFSERTLHSSYPNSTTDTYRLGMSGRYVRPDTRFHNPWVLGKGGLNISYLQIKGLQLDRWHALLIRGQDWSGVNGDRVKPYRHPLARGA